MMDNIEQFEEFQVGDIVRVQRAVELIPLDERAPSFIPAGIIGEVVDLRPGLIGEVTCIIDFDAPYQHFNAMAHDPAIFELVFRIPLAG